MKKKILVTGGFGFIGGHLIELLLTNTDNYVHVIDNLSTNPIPYKQLLKEIPNTKNLTYDLISIQYFFKKIKCKDRYDEIYHLASPVGPAGVLKFAGKMIKTVVDDIYLLMEMALKQKSKLVNISTSEVYGGGRDGYCSENCSKIVPAVTTVRLEYAIAKLAAETALINTCRITKLKASIIRPFNIAGPRQSGAGGFVLPRFIAQAMANKPITVFAKGDQIRAFTNVTDMADGIMRVMKYGKIGEAYNLGNPHNKTTILNLAKTVVKIVNPKAKIIFVDPKEVYGPLYEDANDKYPDSDKAMSELKWSPEKDITQTVLDAYEYMAKCSPTILKMLSGDL